jgi:cyclic pyranopterin monophosphate synthase
MKELTHVDDKGKAKMVDIGAKPVQLREAVAEGFIRLEEETVALIRDNQIKKGDVLTIAQIAGIQGGKRTSELIPLCHPLAISSIDVHTELVKDGIKITAEARCEGKTGIEMEALTAVAVALLTVYDMCKAVDKKMEIGPVKLLSKIKEDIKS